MLATLWSIFRNPYVLLAVGIVASVIYIAGYLEGRKVGFEKGVAACQQECKKAQEVTKEANDALQKDRDRIAAKLAAAKRLPAVCVPVAGKTDSSKAGAGHAGPNVASDWLLDYAAECEGYRSTVIALDKFLDEERAR